MEPLSPLTLEGPRVRLVPLSLSHLDALVAMRHGPLGTFRYVSCPADRPGIERWVHEALELQARGLALPFTTLDAATSAVIGSTRFGAIERWSWPPGHERPGTPSGIDGVEIGWTWFAEAMQRTGRNTEAKLLMLTHAFETWGVRRVTWKVDSRNTRSRAAVTSLGATLDGVLRTHMPGFDGAIRDTAFFSMLHAEWPRAKERLIARLAQGVVPMA